MSLRRRGCRIVLGAVVVLLGLTCLGVGLTVLAPPEDEGDREVEAEAGGPTASPTSQPTPWVITTQKEERIPVGRSRIAYIDGRDPEGKPPYTLLMINVWDGVPRRKVRCRLSHGDKVNVVTARWYIEEKRYYFEIEDWPCNGWISEPFLSRNKEDPVGDIIY